MRIIPENIEKELHDREISETQITKPVIISHKLLEERSETSSEISNRQDLYEEFTNWKLTLTPTLGNKIKSNAIGEL